MRDPFLWSFPIGRLFGINIRVHYLFPVVCLGLILREAFLPTRPPGTWIDAAMLMGLLFLTVFLHELGHCFAARRMNGDASDVLLWPLGGLAAVDIPHNPKAHFVTAAGGPLVNVGICLVCALALAFMLEPGYLPPLNPLWYPYRLPDGNGAIALASWGSALPATNNLAAIILARLFWVSWITLLLNVVLIGFPLDGGRMFQSLLWPYFGYRQATLYAVFTGFGVMFLVLIASLVFNEVLFLCLGLFIYVACRQEWLILETGGEESLFGYDFSQGYTSLERDQPPVKPARKKSNFVQRWLQRRAARKRQRDQEREEAETRRVDELLEKIQRHGKDSLTDEESRFLKRYADRMKNK